MLKANYTTEIKNDYSLLVNAWLGFPGGRKVELKLFFGPTNVLNLVICTFLLLSSFCYLDPVVRSIN